MTSEPTAARALHGTPLTTDSSVSCDDCTTTLEAGDSITVQAAPQEWTPTAAFCPACTPDATDDRTVTVEGWLTTTVDPQTIERVLTFATTDYDLENLPLDITGTGTDPPATTDQDPNEDEGPDADPADPTPEPERALIPFRSNRADRVFHFDDGEGAPLCDARGEFEAVPIDEASDHAPRACRDCEREQRGHPKTRPCPYCGESIVLFHWPHHVSDCSESAQGTTDSDPATDPDSNTNAERGAPTDDWPEQHGRSESTTDSERRVPRIDRETDAEPVTRPSHPYPTRTDDEYPLRIDRHQWRIPLANHPSRARPTLIITRRAAILSERTSTEKIHTSAQHYIRYSQTGSTGSNDYESSVRTRDSQLGTQLRRKGKNPEQPSLFGHWSKSYRQPADALAIRSRDWNQPTRGPRSPPASRSIDRPVARRVAVRQRPTGRRCARRAAAFDLAHHR